MNTMERWYQAVDRRCSIRKYKSGVKNEVLSDLQEVGNSISVHGIRIAVSTADDVFAQKLGATQIKGTDCFAAIISRDGRSTYAGYIGEMFVLECVARDYGTCWVGSSFRQKVVSECIELQKGEKVVAIIAIGIPAEPFVTRKRCSIQKLVNMSPDEFSKLPLWQQSAIECARRAPSAGNAQPWGFEIPPLDSPDANTICVFDVGKNMGFYRLDCGIAMLHIELGAYHFGISGNWSEEPTGYVFTPIIPKQSKSALNFDELLWAEDI